MHHVSTGTRLLEGFGGAVGALICAAIVVWDIRRLKAQYGRRSAIIGALQEPLESMVFLVAVLCLGGIYWMIRGIVG